MKLILSIFGAKKTNVPEAELLNEEKKFYVYEWFVKESGKIFYVGKGTGDRYKSKDRNYMFKMIEYQFEIDVRIVKDGLSEHEAYVLEESLLVKYARDGEVLINTVTVADEGLFDVQELSYFTTPYIMASRVYKHYFNMNDKNYDEIDPEKLQFSYIPKRSYYGMYKLYLKNANEHMQNHYFEPVIEDAIQKVSKSIEDTGGRVYKSKSTKVQCIIETTQTTYESYQVWKNEGYDVYHLIDVMKYFGLEVDESKKIEQDKNRVFIEVKGKGKKIIDRHYYLLGEIRELKPKYTKGLIDADQLIPLLKEDIELHQEFVKYYAMESDVQVSYPAFKELAVIYEKEGEYQKAIDVSKRALEENVNEETSFERRISKLEKKLSHS